MTLKLLLLGGFNRSCYNLQPPWQTGANEQLQRCCRWEKENQIIKHSVGANPYEHGFCGHMMTQVSHNSLSNWHQVWECGSSHRLSLSPAQCRLSSELLHNQDLSHDEHAGHGSGWFLPAETQAEPLRSN